MTINDIKLGTKVRYIKIIPFDAWRQVPIIGTLGEIKEVTYRYFRVNWDNGSYFFYKYSQSRLESIEVAVDSLPITVVPPPILPEVKQEKPCNNCKRNNFVGDTKCWWCESPNPC